MAKSLFEHVDEAKTFVLKEGANEAKIDELLKDYNNRKAKGPNRYLYAICEYLDWNVPMFLDPAAGGVRLRYNESSKENAEETLEEVKKAGADLGIRIVKAIVKRGHNGWQSFMVIPRYEGEIGNE